jgi:predicted nuclease with TOPRIM domain
MSDQTFSLSSLNEILEQARADAAKCKKDLEKAKGKVEAAESRVKTLEDTISQLSGGNQGRTQKEMILQILKDDIDSFGDGMTAREIVTAMEKVGFKISSQNPTASIHTAAEELRKKGEIEIIKSDDRGTIFKPTSA